MKAASDSKNPSSAHMVDHSRRVWKRCRALSKAVGGDSEVLVAAAYLHDLGRHGGHIIHGQRSARLAKPILVKERFPKEKIPDVLDAIAVHDWQTPDRMRKTLESRILYDADKLDVFGAIGVKRHILYFYHNKCENASANDIIRILQTKWRSLCLKESRKLAKKDYEYGISFFKRLAAEEGGQA
ncbi:MAG: HD domain-containing protein [Candidatus Altiarchaeota archaeon]